VANSSQKEESCVSEKKITTLNKEKRMMEIYARYSKYSEQISRLVEIDLFMIPKIDQLKLKPKQVQGCYREMKKINFQGNFIDFICWVSIQYLFIEWSKLAKHIDEVEAFKGVCNENKEAYLNLIRAFGKRPALIFENPLFIGSASEIYDVISSMRKELLFSKKSS
jgi:hypothetical protein